MHVVTGTNGMPRPHPGRIDVHNCAYAVRVEWTADVIRARREARGLTQQQLADEVGVSRSVVNKWETGGRDPGGRSIRGLDRVLGTPDLIEGVSVADATDTELLTELLRRRLAADRTSGAPKPDLPTEHLAWDDEPGESQDDGDPDTGQP